MLDTSIRQHLIEINEELAGLIVRAAETIRGSSGDRLSDWLDACRICRKRLDDDTLRMAVVGTIKSGKSTFINSLFSGEYLKRGAGVITSIVTKVRRSDRLRADLFLKSWDEINSEIQKALRLLPSSGWRTRQDPFDLRNPVDRDDLKLALDSLESKHLLGTDTRNMNSALLSAYLNGYPQIASMISDRMEIVTLEDDRFGEQKAFAGSETLAVYLKDIRLEIPSGDIERNIEIADCQGSDSPNPLHLVMIEDYLRTADLLVYLVSSRTGLRQADFRFLRIIKEMVGTSHVLFIVNADFSEHESIEDLRRVAGKVREDLALIVKEPSIYIYSALFSLFSSRKDLLPKKDRLRLDQWSADDGLAAFSESEKDRFARDFRHLITDHRYNLLLRNQVQRMRLLTAAFRQWLDLNREVLGSDAAGAESLLARIRQQQKKTERIRGMIKSTFDGAAAQLKREIRSEVDRFFDIRYGTIGPGIRDFVTSYTVSYESYGKQLNENGFSNTLSAVFQAFTQDLDLYMAENVNPVLFAFIREKESGIREHFEAIARPFEAMITETLAEYRAGGNGGTDNGAGACRLDLETIKEKSGLEVPPAAATLAYTATLKTETFMRLGLHRAINMLRKVFKRGEERETVDLPALKGGVSRMKRDTEGALTFHFKNYRENLKFQYLFKVIESVSEEMLTLLSDRFNAYQTDLAELKAMAGQDHEGKAAMLDAVSVMSDTLLRIRNRMDALDGQIRQA